MMSNSRFTGNISGLAEIFTGKAEKNFSNTLSSGSHNSLIRALIHAKLIPLESQHLKLSNSTKNDLFWISKNLEKLPRKR